MCCFSMSGGLACFEKKCYSIGTEATHITAGPAQKGGAQCLYILTTSLNQLCHMVVYFMPLAQGLERTEF